MIEVSYWINLGVILCIICAVVFNKLTNSPLCGWSSNRTLDKSFDELCADNVSHGAYCKAKRVGMVWFIGSLIAMILNIVSFMISCYYDKYKTQVQKGEREHNPIPKNLAIYLNLICGIVIVLSAISFQYGQDICDAKMSNFGSSMILTYIAAAILLTFVFCIFPLAIIFCVFA